MFFYPDFQAACLAVRLLVGPLRMLAFLLRLLAFLLRLLAFLLQLLAFLLRLLAGFKGSACLLRGLLALPWSSVASRSPLARCLCQYARLSCVVSRLVFFVVYLLSIAAALARRACSPASPDEFVSRSSSHVV